jgi:hypothetical protein
MEVNFRFRKDLVERVKQEAEASGTTIEQLIIGFIEQLASGEDTKLPVKPTRSLPQRDLQHRRVSSNANEDCS